MFFPFQPSGRKLNLRLCHDNIHCSSPQPCLFDDLFVVSPVPNSQAIGDRPQRRDNLTTEVNPGAAPVSQVTLKDDSYGNTPKQPKIKEKKLKSCKAQLSEKAKE